MHRWLAISGMHCPTVLCGINPCRTEVNHRFDSKYQVFPEYRPPAPTAIIGHVRFFVHTAAQSVPYELAYHHVSKRLNMTLYRMADVARTVNGYGLFVTEISRPLGRPAQLQELIWGFTDNKRKGMANVETGLQQAGEGR